LKSTGIKILLAGNGREALELQAEHPEISIILMDMKMPEIDGYEAARMFKTKGVRIPVIATTAFALAGDRKKCLAAGCDDYLAKPILRDKLFVILEKYLPKS
jgi:CheY-like chemotaxis protein